MGRAAGIIIAAFREFAKSSAQIVVTLGEAARSYPDAIMGLSTECADLSFSTKSAGQSSARRPRRRPRPCADGAACWFREADRWRQRRASRHLKRPARDPLAPAAG